MSTDICECGHTREQHNAVEDSERGLCGHCACTHIHNEQPDPIREFFRRLGFDGDGNPD